MRDSKESIILVHYFDEVNKEATGRHLSADVPNSNVTKGAKRSLPVAKASLTGTMLPFRQPSPPKPLSSEETVESIMKSMQVVSVLLTMSFYSNLCFCILLFRLFRDGLRASDSIVSAFSDSSL